MFRQGRRNNPRGRQEEKMSVIKEYQCQDEEIGKRMNVTKQSKRRKENSLLWELPESLEDEAI